MSKELELFDCEKVYDEEISPLITQIIEICNKHKMPMLASFAYEHDEENGIGHCTTLLNCFENRYIENLQNANREVRTQPHCMSMMITKG